MWNYFHQRRDYLEDHRLGYKPDEPLGPYFHPMVAATMHIGASDILPESLPPDPPSCMTLIPPSVQACLEALHIVQSASGEDLRAAAQMCSSPVRVYFHQSSKSINFQYQAWAPTDVPPVPEPIGLPLNPEKYPVVVESPTYSVSTTDESSDSDDSSTTYEDSDIVTVVAELVTDVENQLKENADPTDAPLTHREIVALVEAIPNFPAP